MGRDAQHFERAVARCNRAGEREGWGIFLCDGRGVFEIQRDDEAGIFEDDDAAIAYVQARADAGSELHKLALQLVS